MDTKQYFRRPFDVNAVEVTPDNASKVAEWCGGTVEMGEYKHSKYRIQLPVVKVPGNGPNKGKSVDARIGYFVVEHNGSFRVYRPKQFEETFHAYVEDRPYFKPGDLVRDPDNGLEGTVLHVDQVLVTFGGSTHVLFERDQLQHITEFSPKTLERLRDIEAAEIGLDKINALRQAAEDAIMGGAVQMNMAGDVAVEHSPVVEINGYRKDMRVRVKYEHNAFVDQFGTIEALGDDGVTIFVNIDSDPGADSIRFQPDELEPIGPKLETGDMIETLVPHDFDGEEIPVGTNGRVVEIDTCEGHNHHVMFADGHYSWFAAYHLKKS